MPALRHGLLSPLNKGTPREEIYSSMKAFVTESEHSPRRTQAGPRSRNDLMSQSVTMNSTRSVPMEVLGRQAETHTRNMRGGSAIEIRDIIENS